MTDHTLQEVVELSVKTALLKTHPVGSLYCSMNDTSPETLFGGTWERIKDVFLLAAGDKYTAGAAGGEESVTLTASNMPDHSHSVSCSSAGGHDHISKLYSTNNGSYSMATDGLRASGMPWVYAGNLTAGSAGGDNCGVSSWAGDHTHTITIGSTGGGQAFSIMPPYMVVYVWERTA